MADNKLVRAQQAFTLVVLEKKTLREAAELMACSYETVRRSVKEYQEYLADERRNTSIEQRRASLNADLDLVYRNALYIYDKYRDSKPLVSVSALNTIASLFQHYRAVNGADMPKEVRQDIQQAVRVIWAEDDTDHQYPND